MKFRTEFSASDRQRLKALDDKMTCPFFRSTVEDVAAALSLVYSYDQTLQLLLKCMGDYRDAVYSEISGMNNDWPTTTPDLVITFAICDILDGKFGPEKRKGMSRRSVFEFFCRYWRNKLEPDLPPMSDDACRRGRERWANVQVVSPKPA